PTRFPRRSWTGSCSRWSCPSRSATRSWRSGGVPTQDLQLLVAPRDGQDHPHLDRPLPQVVLPIPERDQDLEILRRHAAGFDPRDVRAAGVTAVAGPADIAAGRAAVRTVEVSSEVVGYIVDIAGATRQSPSLSLGVSPRGATALLHSARA